MVFRVVPRGGSSGRDTGLRRLRIIQSSYIFCLLDVSKNLLAKADFPHFCCECGLKRLFHMAFLQSCSEACPTYARNKLFINWSIERRISILRFVFLSNKRMELAFRWSGHWRYLLCLHLVVVKCSFLLLTGDTVIMPGVCRVSRLCWCLHIGLVLKGLALMAKRMLRLFCELAGRGNFYKTAFFTTRIACCFQHYHKRCGELFVDLNSFSLFYFWRKLNHGTVQVSIERRFLFLTKKG